MKVFLPEAIVPMGRNVIRLIKKLTGDNYSAFFDDNQIRNISGKCLFLCGHIAPLGDCEKKAGKANTLKNMKFLDTLTVYKDRQT